jgi:hypothetical protein
MHYIYICRPGKNEELRYSIRSICKNTNVSDITIFGGTPSWFNGKSIKVKDISKSKFDNIHNLVSVVANHEDTPEEFILMNDDFFVMNPISTMPLFGSDLLSEKIAKYKSSMPSNPYIKFLDQTNKYLKQIGISHPIDFDLHVPMPIKKSILKETIKHKSLYRSTYGNLSGLFYEKMDDVKIYSGSRMQLNYSGYLDENATFVSTSDNSFKDAFYEVIKDKFAEKSIFEK